MVQLNGYIYILADELGSDYNNNPTQPVLY